MSQICMCDPGSCMMIFSDRNFRFLICQYEHLVSSNATIKYHDITLSFCIAKRTMGINEATLSIPRKCHLEASCMDKSQKKIVWSQLLCFLCGCPLTKEWVRTFGKSSVDTQDVIKAAIDSDVTVFSSSELFICTSNYYKRLIPHSVLNNFKKFNFYEKRHQTGVWARRIKEQKIVEWLWNECTTKLAHNVCTETVRSGGTSAAKS